MTLPSTRSTLILLFLALIALGPALSAQRPEGITVEINGTTYNAKKLEELKQTIDGYRSLVPEKDPTEAQLDIKARIDRAQNKLQSLIDLMTRLDGADQTITKAQTATKAAEAELAVLKKSLENPQIPDPIDEVKEKEILAEAQAAEQSLKSAQAELDRRLAKVAERQKKFDSSAQDLEPLTTEKAAAEAKLQQEDISAEEREVLNLKVLRTILDIRTLELERDNHPRLEALDREARLLAQAELEAAKVRKQLQDARLAAARVKLKDKLDADKAKAEKEAKAKEEEARATESKANKALLGFESLVASMRARKSDEEQARNKFAAEVTELEATLKTVEDNQKQLDELLPDDQDLDETRGNYLRLQQNLLSEKLPREQQRLLDLTERVAKTQRTVAVTNFAIDTFISRLEAEDDSTLVKTRERRDGLNGKPDDFMADWQKHKIAWIEGLAEREAEISQRTSEFEKSLMRSTTDAWRKRWDEAEKETKQLLADRKETNRQTSTSSLSALKNSKRIVQILEERESRLEAMAFWLKSDPPFSELRRDSMGSELASLWSNLKALAISTWASFSERLRGIFGICGIIALALGLGLAIFRRAKSAPIERIEKIVAFTKDPLVEFAVVLSWLVFETGHHLLFILGLCLIWRSPMPEDPFICAAVALISIATIRLAASRLVSYLSESAEDVDTILSLEARRFLRFAVIGFFLTVPAVYFFDRADAIDTAEASRFAATLWAFIVVLRLTFRRHLLGILVPSRSGEAIGNGIRTAIRWAFPLVMIFVGVIVVLQFLGYQNASRELVKKSLLTSGFLIAITIVYQFIRAFIESRTISVIENAELAEQTQEFMTRARQRQLEAFYTIFSLPLIVVTLIGGVAGSAAIFGLIGPRWDKFSSSFVFQQAAGESGMTWGNVLAATLTFVVGYVIARVVRDLIVVGIGTPHDDRRGGHYALGTLVFYTLVIITLFVGLQSLQVNLKDYGWLLGTAGVAIGFGLTQILSNFVSGLILFVERPVQVGDIVTIGDIEGDVRKISIRSTIVRTRDGVSIILPNRKLIEEDVVNWSHSDPKTRLRVPVGVAYGSDVALVKKVLLEVAEKEGRIMKRPRPEVNFKEFGESELSFELLTWLATPDITVRRKVRSDVNSAIDAAFRRFHIEIPFPQRDLHIKNTPTTLERKRLAAEDEDSESAEQED